MGETACRDCGLVLAGPWNGETVFPGPIDELDIGASEGEQWKGKFNEEGFQGEAPTALGNHPRGSSAATHWQKGDAREYPVELNHSAQHDLGRSVGDSDSRAVRREQEREMIYQRCTINKPVMDRARRLRDTDPYVGNGWCRKGGNEASAIGYAAVAQFDSESAAIAALGTSHPISNALDFERVGNANAEEAIRYAFRRMRERVGEVDNWQIQAVSPDFGRIETRLAVA